MKIAVYPGSFDPATYGHQETERHLPSGRSRLAYGSRKVGTRWCTVEPRAD